MKTRMKMKTQTRTRMPKRRRPRRRLLKLWRETLVKNPLRKSLLWKLWKKPLLRRKPPKSLSKRSLRRLPEKSMRQPRKPLNPPTKSQRNLNLNLRHRLPRSLKWST